jgi:hypothetical protein
MATRRRRRRRSSSEVIAQRSIIEIKQRKRAFLREVGEILSDALGFHVKVTLAKPSTLPADATPAMRKAHRLPKAQAKRQIADSMHAPLAPRPGRRKGIPGLDDDTGL